MGVNPKVKVKWIIPYGPWRFGVDDKIGRAGSERMLLYLMYICSRKTCLNAYQFQANANLFIIKNIPFCMCLPV